MLVTSHVLAGAVIGRILARHPVGAFAAGMVSHFAMDACPHWGDPEGGRDDLFLRVARCDGCCGLASIALAAGFSPRSGRAAVVGAMVGGALPDIDKPLEHFFGWNPFPEPFNRFHQRIQRESPQRLPQEVVTAGILGVVTAMVLAAYRRS